MAWKTSQRIGLKCSWESSSGSIRGACFVFREFIIVPPAKFPIARTAAMLPVIRDTSRAGASGLNGENLS
jgi:hypothetical protein